MREEAALGHKGESWQAGSLLICSSERKYFSPPQLWGHIGGPEPPLVLARWQCHSSATLLEGSLTRAGREDSPAWCGSVGWTLPHKAKSLWFYPQSGHMPGLRVQSLVRCKQRQSINISLLPRCFSPPLSPSLPFSLSLPLSLKINK